MRAPRSWRAAPGRSVRTGRWLRAAQGVDRRAAGRGRRPASCSRTALSRASRSCSPPAAQPDRLRVLVEAPSYDRPLKLLAERGADVGLLPLDDDGLDPAAVEDAGPAAALLYTIPTFQNPSGRTLSADRRRQLAELAQEGGLLVLEDDPYGLVRFAGEARAFTVRSDRRREHRLRVVVLEDDRPRAAGRLDLPPADACAAVEAGAVSRTISPLLPRRRPSTSSCAGACSSRTWSGSVGCSAPGATRCSKRSSASYPHRRRVKPARRRLLRVARPPGEVDATELLDRAAAAGVTFVPGADFFPAGRRPSSARLAFSFASTEEIREGVARLAALVPHPAAVDGRTSAAAAAVRVGRGTSRGLRRRRQRAALCEPERGAGRLAREGAQTGAPEIAVITSSSTVFAHLASCYGFDGRGPGAMAPLRAVVQEGAFTKWPQFPGSSEMALSRDFLGSCQPLQRLSKTLHRHDPHAVCIAARLACVVPSRDDEDLRACAPSADHLLVDAAHREHRAVERERTGDGDLTAVVDVAAEVLEEGERERAPLRGPRRRRC